jgi:hypothetical protein
VAGPLLPSGEEIVVSKGREGPKPVTLVERAISKPDELYLPNVTPAREPVKPGQLGG